MGCGLSKRDGGDDLVSLCKERKRLMKMAVKQRQAFADSHSKYIHSLSSVSSALHLLIARYTNTCPPPPPRLCIECPSSPTIQTALSKSAHEAICPFHPSDPTNNPETEEEEEEDPEEVKVRVCEFFYGDKPPPPMPSPERGMGWDFFNFFDSNSLETMSLMRGNWKDGEQQEVEDHEEDLSGPKGGKRKSFLMRKWDDENGGIGNGSQFHMAIKKSGAEEEKVGKVNNEEENKDGNGMKLLDALKDVEDHFLRAYESCFLNVSRILELNKLHPPSCFQQIKENSKLINSISCHQSISSQSSPCTSLLSYSSSHTSSTWTECKSCCLFDASSGEMQTGSHSFTLGRLYAWEKKLFEEVKAGDKNRRFYQKKYELLKKQIEGEDKVRSSKARAEVTGSYTKVFVARTSAESIFKRIEKLRDEELQPQILELLHGLMRTWKIMLESHEIQARTMRQVRSFSSSDACGKSCNDSHRLATLELEAGLQNWHACFFEYMACQKAYVKTLHDWLCKSVNDDVSEFLYSNRRSTIFQVGTETTLLATTCHRWIEALETLPQKAVKTAIKSLAKDVRGLWVQQGEEQHQNRKVDEIGKEIERRAALTLQKQEHKKKDLMDQLMKKLDLEKVKHHDSMAETKVVAFNGLATGFSRVFESLLDFSKDSAELYAALLSSYENARQTDDDTLSK
ncbi:hypothetical protein Dimus_017416 [Dionaea muscipula]